MVVPAVVRLHKGKRLLMLLLLHLQRPLQLWRCLRLMRASRLSLPPPCTWTASWLAPP